MTSPEAVTSDVPGEDAPRVSPDASKERLIPPGYVLQGRFTLTGYPGTGKGAILDILKESYNLAPEQVRRAGDIFFRKDPNITAFQDRSIKEDVYADSTMVEWLLDPDSSNTFGLETRAAVVLRKMELDKLRAQHKRLPTQVPVVTVLLTAPREIRLNRATLRDMKKPVNQGKDYWEVRREGVIRQEKDLRRLRKAHPELADINPMSESAAQWYDVVVDTSATVEEVAHQIHQILEAKGVVGKSQSQNTGLVIPTLEQTIAVSNTGIEQFRN